MRRRRHRRPAKSRLFESLARQIKKQDTCKSICPVFGTPEGIRTPDLLVRSQTLYPAELLAHSAISRRLPN